MKTSELTRRTLNWAVNHAEGLTGTLSPVNYCGKWEHGGPIIEREGITLDYDYEGPTLMWGAKHFAFDGTVLQQEYGPTPLVAAMRCYVASKLGDDVDVPKELT